MTRLVVHAGTHATGWSATQQQLVSWRPALESLGVHLHAFDEPEAWLADTLQLATGAPPPSVIDAVDRAVAEHAEVLLLSSERLEDPLRDPARVATLVAFASERSMPLTVLVVVRDQLGYLNHLYGERVGHLQMARDFPSFAADPSPAGRFDYPEALGALMAAPEVDLLALPYADLPPGAEGKSLVTALGVAPQDLAGLPDGPPRPAGPGPVLLAATRLLFKRLWRLGLVTKLPRPKLVQSARALAAHAGQRGWDAEAFWGWDDRARAAAIARYGPGNDAFAQAVWGRPWGDWETHEPVDIDLPSCDPRLVVDVLSSVDAIVSGLQSVKASVVSD